MNSFNYTMTNLTQSDVILTKYSSECVDFVTNKISLDCLIDKNVFNLNNMIMYSVIALYCLMVFYDTINIMVEKFTGYSEDITAGIINVIMSALLLFVLYIGDFLSIKQIIIFAVAMLILEYLVMVLNERIKKKSKNL